MEGVELGHEVAVGGARGRQIIVPFTELGSEVGDSLFEVGDLLLEGVDVGGGSEPCGTPGVLTEDLGKPLFEPDDVLGLTGSTLSEVGEEGPTADLRGLRGPPRVACCEP
ncbi:hypothetical protein AB0F05_34430 [Streptomyces microflavus]|uniref:hypothetical protein n=1 Tax=Streptomyces microflavus TaxID=1919 RepID=UPI00340FFF92